MGMCGKAGNATCDDPKYSEMGFNDPKYAENGLNNPKYAEIDLNNPKYTKIGLYNPKYAERRTCLLEVEVLVLVQLDVRGDGVEREVVLHQLDVQVRQVGCLPAPGRK